MQVRRSSGARGRLRSSWGRLVREAGRRWERSPGLRPSAAFRIVSMVEGHTRAGALPAPAATGVPGSAVAHPPRETHLAMARAKESAMIETSHTTEAPRTGWADEKREEPRLLIEDHALLGDLHTAALV